MEVSIEMCIELVQIILCELYSKGCYFKPVFNGLDLCCGVPADTILSSVLLNLFVEPLYQIICSFRVGCH